MDGEIKSFIKVWSMAISSLCYCYYIVARMPKGVLRFLSLLPVLCLFLTIPFSLQSCYLGTPTAFLLIWLGNSKLLLFSIDKGPLSPPPNNLFQFICIACLPIKIKKDPYQPKVEKPRFLFVTKALLLAMILIAYDFKPNLHPYVLLGLYQCHSYLAIEIILTLAASPARLIPGLRLEQQFNEPYLATSLQDFWGRRWNLVTVSILHSTVYKPVCHWSQHIIGSRWAADLVPLLAVFMTFLVSGLMHEVLFYYLTRVPPTFEVTSFFIVQGICVIIEVVFKRKVITDRWRLHRAISRTLTIGFLVGTSVWLFLPQLLRNGVFDKAIREHSIVVQEWSSIINRSFHVSSSYSLDKWKRHHIEVTRPTSNFERGRKPKKKKKVKL
nr:probable long-chain-alcohol O-fatty-acyltransferase 5 [Quercus suber]